MNFTNTTGDTLTVADYLNDFTTSITNFITGETNLNTLNDFLLKYSKINLNIQPVFITHFLMISTATIVLILISYSSFTKPVNSLKPDLNSSLFHPDDLSYLNINNRGISSVKIEEKQALFFPIYSAISIVTLFYSIKYLNIVAYINYFFKFYTSGWGFLGMVSNFSNIIQGTLRRFGGFTVPIYRLTFSEDPSFGTGFSKTELEDDQFEEEIETETETDENENDENEKDKKKKEENLPLIIEPKDQINNLYISLTGIIGTPISLFIIYLYSIDGNNWFILNLITLSIAIYTGRILKLSNFKTAFILFFGLFLYDIYFVFGTTVMITVATSKELELPGKITIPRPYYKNETVVNDYHNHPSSLLGLGDIVVPSMFLSVCLRFDAWKFYNQNEKLSFHYSRKFPKTYFITGVISYVFGLTLTIIVMHFSEHGQPALLYLCPSIAFSTLIVAWFRGELKLLLSFKDEKEKKKKIKEQLNEKDEIDKKLNNNGKDEVKSHYDNGVIIIDE